MKRLFFAIVLLGCFVWILNIDTKTLHTAQIVNAQTENPEDTWPMSAANPQRTSHNEVGVGGKLYPQWFTPIEPYIMSKVQIIAADNTLFISTANGLYGLYATDPDGPGPLQAGYVRWIYPTELPLGNSPTISNGVAYVGGFDKKIHGVDITNGNLVWETPEAEAGFDTNPLVLETEGLVIAGNRDGNMYAYNISNGQVAWTFPTGGPIDQSAAYSNGKIFFASNDSHAYAINVLNGSQLWQSPKLPGSGFHSFWPVIYQDKVIFAGSLNYRGRTPPFNGFSENTDIGLIGASGEILCNSTVEYTIIGDWVSNTPTADASCASQYYNNYPERRTYFIFDQQTGIEFTFDGGAYAPITWFGKANGDRYPPIVGYDGVLYQTNKYIKDPAIPRGNISGWSISDPNRISFPSSLWQANDEPFAYSSGGNYIYYNKCCDRSAGVFDLSKANCNLIGGICDPNTSGPDGVINGPFNREWTYFDEGGNRLKNLVVGYNNGYYEYEFGEDPVGFIDITNVFGTRNGVYSTHGDQNPPIPYKGYVFMHRGNSIIAFGPTDQGVISTPNPLAQIQSVQSTPNSVDQNNLVQKLESELSKMIASGPLLPGFQPNSLFAEATYISNQCGDRLVDYWKDPSETIIILLETLPYIQNTTLKNQVKNYIQTEFQNANYLSGTPVKHIGYSSSNRSPRETFIIPPEMQTAMSSYTPISYLPTGSKWFEGWDYPPMAFYTMWKYAEEFDTGTPNQTAIDLLNANQSRLETTPADSLLIAKPFILNAYIAGYRGYMELERLAGTISLIDQSSKYTEYNRLLNLRINNFTKEVNPIEGQLNAPGYCRALNTSWNFIYMTPELASEMQSRIPNEVQSALDEYETIAPYWFVSNLTSTFGEGIIHPYYDFSTLFQTNANILNKPQNELIKYLDVPAVEVGDLYYIQNLVSIIKASNQSVTPTPSCDKVNGDADCNGSINLTDFIIWKSEFTNGGSLDSDFDGSNTVTLLDFIAWKNGFVNAGN